MFKDAKEELERLEAALQEEEALDTEIFEDPEEAGDILDDEMLDALLAEDERIADGSGDDIYKSNYSNSFRKKMKIYNTDTTDTELDAYSQAVLEEPKEKGVMGLTVMALLLTAGILGVVVFWLLRWGGLL